MIIPDGLANGLELVENESAGNVRSLSKVEPVIDIELGYNIGNKPFEIREEYTKQSVKLIGRDLNNPDLKNPLVQGTKVKIDSENLIVQYKDSNTNKWLLLPVEYIDLNSTFFIIQNQFKFISVNENCRISNVSYYTKH